MRILIFGGDGMLGHQLLRSWRQRHEVFVTLRRDEDAYKGYGLFSPGMARYGVDVRQLQDVVDSVATVRPQAVVNAVGIVKQRPTAQEYIPSLEVNSLFPHRLAQVCRAAGARLVHLSTDCVFSGRRGHYNEGDLPDASDLYGRSKLLGELHEPGCLTLRTSIIGLELSGKRSLVEWYLSQKGSIVGYRRAVYSGLTTAEMARAIEHFLLKDPELAGLWHLASTPISKFELLKGLTERLQRRDIELRPQDDFVNDKSLDMSALNARTEYRVPRWSAMLDDLTTAILERNRDL